MPSYLVSFTIPDDRFGLKLAYGSSVIELPGAPSSEQSIWDLQASLAMEYGVHVAAILNWDFLPDSPSSSDGSISYYFAAYFFASAQGTGFGATTVLRRGPICTLAHLRAVEEWVRSRYQALEVHLISCKTLTEPTPQMLEAYQQMQRSQPE